ncbi:MAG: YggS family pyridoxal phosphate-dependent enzyme [Myxococcota bacterium]|nr:YggS family pyridoxal phosphate-dependent enzyme [Myxococcota bacterium]
MTTNIAKNLEDVKKRIEQAAHKAKRDPADVTLVAVSKRQSVAAIRQAYAAGQRHFGENYAQELRDKAVELRDLTDIRWHFIGHLQRNKSKYIAQSATMLETVDTVRLIEELDRQVGRSGRTLECLVQVNVGREEQKSGCDVKAVPALLDAVETADSLSLKGLMTIPPWDLEPEKTRAYFTALSRLQGGHGGASRLPHLSMGMSADFEVAIAEGATLVRVGTAIFGKRQY